VRAEPDRRFIAVACGKDGTQVWDTADPAQARLLARLPSPTAVPGDFPTSSPAVDAAGDRAAIANGNTVTVYELPGGRVVNTIHHRAAVTTVAFAYSGRDLVTGSIDGSLQVTLSSGEQIMLAHQPAAIEVAGFLADGRVVAADARGRLVVYDVARHASLAELELPSRIAAFRSSRDGRRLLTLPPAGAARSLVLWDLERRRVIAPLDGDKAPVFSARFVRDDRQILTAGTDGAARMWDADSGRLRKMYFRSAPYLIDAALDPGGTMVVTAGGDGVLRFWDVSSGRMLWTLRAHDARVAGIHFEGGDMVTRGFNGEIARLSLVLAPQLGLTLDHIVECLPLRFDDETGGLVEQERGCDHETPSHR
jgi:WD40 repeat protein